MRHDGGGRENRVGEGRRGGGREGVMERFNEAVFMGGGGDSRLYSRLHWQKDEF